MLASRLSAADRFDGYTASMSTVAPRATSTRRASQIPLKSGNLAHAWTLGILLQTAIELRRRVASDEADDAKFPFKREQSVTELTMFVRLVAVVGGIVIVVSLVMGSIQ